MKPVFTVAHGSESPVVPPPPQPLHHGPPAGLHMDGQGRRRWRIGGVGARRVLGLLLFLGVTVGFAFAVRRARRSHSGRDLAFAIVTYYLVVVFACCVAKLRQLQRDPAAATAAERRRVRIGTWVVSAALGTVATLRIVEAMPGLALKLVVGAVSLVLHGIGLYFFLRKGAEGGDAEEIGGGRPATALRSELSPEEKV